MSERTPAYEPPPGSIPTMTVPSLEGIERVHLIGIGGAGMRGIARLLLARGIAVAGSDLKDSSELAALRDAGVAVSVGHRADRIGEGGPLDAVVISSAIPEGNPELEAARRLGIPVFRRAQLLAALARDHRALAVSGTHGKTTTTSMLAVILERCGLDPTYLIGGDLNEIGSGARSGEGSIFVAEADESDGSFLLMEPAVAVVTNVEDDHLDFYGEREAIVAAFADFVASAEEVVACGDDPGTRAALARSGRSARTYGMGAGNDVRVGFEADGDEGATGSLTFRDGRSVRLALRTPGAHNVLNAAAAVVTAGLAGVEPERAADVLETFGGVRRRFERRGDAGGAAFVDDYAHHPTELAATLAAARRGDRRVLAVFQPHRYSRTQVLWRELGASLAGADVVVVTDVYAAGEEPVPGVTGKLVVDALAESAPGKRIVYLPHRADVAPFLAGEVREGDLVLTLGAGDVTMVGEETIERIREGS